MTVGALCSIGANLIWGLAFPVPVALPEADSIDLALGRYLCFGAISVGILAIGGRRRLMGVDLRAWSTALLFAFTGHFGYYLLLVQGIRWAGAPVTTVIIRMLPVSVAIAGNLLRREFPFVRLAFPLVGLSTGLSLVYLTELDWQSAVSGRSGRDWAAGIASAGAALALWTCWERRIPPALEFLRFALIVVGVLDAIRRTRTFPAVDQAAGHVSAIRKNG